METFYMIQYFPSVDKIVMTRNAEFKDKAFLSCDEYGRMLNKDQYTPDFDGYYLLLEKEDIASFKGKIKRKITETIENGEIVDRKIQCFGYVFSEK